MANLNVNVSYLEDVSNYFKYPSVTYLMQTSSTIKGRDNNFHVISTMYENFKESQMAFAVWQYENVDTLEFANIKYFPNKEMATSFILGAIK